MWCGVKGGKSSSLRNPPFKQTKSQITIKINIMNIELKKHNLKYSILEVLVKLAADDKLPMDMTCLDADIFDKPIEEFIKAMEPTPEEKQLQNAAHYLCETDEHTIADQLKLIEDYPDDSALIDDIEGVTVWEKLEYSFTCKSFFESI